MSIVKPLSLLLSALIVPLPTSGYANPPAHAQGHNPPHTAGNSGKVPPGQMKKYTRGSKLPHDWKSYDRIYDLDRYRLPRLRPGEVYLRIDGEIVKVLEDTSTVLEAMGIVSNWLK
ncbi:MAG: hypothetical protein KDA50_14500 [Rhodobacteraceae bacterium]|nr:hypothetical protein [Paracoccaceae bacterium]